MSKKGLIELCRYYKGEDTCPKNVPQVFWNYEKAWVEFSLNGSPLLTSMVREYYDYGMFDFNKQDDVPFSLKALLFNRYEQWLQGSLDEFKEWYKRQYLKEMNLTGKTIFDFCKDKTLMCEIIGGEYTENYYKGFPKTVIAEHLLEYAYRSNDDNLRKAAASLLKTAESEWNEAERQANEKGLIID